MLRLFKKKKERPQVEDIKSQSSENESSDFFFNFEYLPEDKKKEKIYLYEWLKNDGEWIDEGQPLYSIRLGEYLGVGTAMVSEPILSKRRGVIQHLKDKDQIIQIGDKVYTIHPKSVYEKENSIQNERFYVYFDKYKYKIPDKYSHHNLRIKQWHKEDGELIKQNDLILTLMYSTSYNNKETINHYAEKNGYLDKAWNALYFMDLEQNKLLYIINDNDDERINRKFINTPDIKIDEFTSNKNIQWQRVGSTEGYSQGITSTSIDKRISLTFTFNNMGSKDFIVFQFRSKELMLSKEDLVSFLFSDNRIIDFKINANSYKSSHPHIDKLFENKVQITDDELLHFEKYDFLKWKILLRKQGREIVGGEEGYNEYQPHKNLVVVIKKFASEYRKLVMAEIPNYEPLIRRQTNTTSNDNALIEECYVYLMLDVNNHYHKIGISNNPEWREKTLLGEKPTIELIVAKKFVSRKIASSIEKALHNTFSDKRIRGEWFNLDPKDIDEIIVTLSS